MSSTKHRLRSGFEDYKGRWEQAGAHSVARPEWLSTLRDLQGDWKVERLSGPLPGPFVWKRIRGSRGETYVLPSPLPAPGLPFEIEQREGHVALVYRPPLILLVDELRLEADGSWLGRATAARIRYAWFRMLPM